MSVWTTPTTRSTGLLVTAAIWNTDIVENLKYLKDSPVFDGSPVVDGPALGIGVTPSGWGTSNDLGAVQITGGALWATGSSQISVGQNYYYNGMLTLYRTSAAASEYKQSGGVHTWSTASSGTAGNVFSFTEQMRLDASGNVGIGTASPNKAGFTRALTIESSSQTGLEIVGSQTTDAAIGNLLWINAAASNAYMGQVSARRDGANNSGALTFSTWNGGSGAERMRITATGNVGIGMTPTYRLDITGGAGSVVARFNQATAGKTGVIFAENGTQRAFLSQVGLYSGNSDGNFGIFVETGYNFQVATNGSVTSKFTVHTGGNIAIGATARLYLDGVAGTGDTYIEEYAANEVRLTVGGAAHSAFNATGQFVYYNPPTTASAANAYIAQTDYIRRSTSSIRYKHDIATLDTTDALSAVMAMRPVTYRGKTDDDQRRFVGFIAEEMQEIAPLLCTYDEGGENGTPNYVTYDRVTAYLVAVVQQQQTEINALKARIH